MSMVTISGGRAGTAWHVVPNCEAEESVTDRLAVFTWYVNTFQIYTVTLKAWLCAWTLVSNFRLQNFYRKHFTNLWFRMFLEKLIFISRNSLLLWNSIVDNSVHRNSSLGYFGSWMPFTLRTPFPELRPSVGLPLSFSISIISSVSNYCIRAAWHAHLVFPVNKDNAVLSFSLEQLSSLLQNSQSCGTRVIIQCFLRVGCLPWLTSPICPSCSPGKGPLAGDTHQTIGTCTAATSCTWTVHTAHERCIWKGSLVARIQCFREARTIPWSRKECTVGGSSSGHLLHPTYLYSTFNLRHP
jgi:hypothetical protein